MRSQRFTPPCKTDERDIFDRIIRSARTREAASGYRSPDSRGMSRVLSISLLARNVCPVSPRVTYREATHSSIELRLEAFQKCLKITRAVLYGEHLNAILKRSVKDQKLAKWLGHVSDPNPPKLGII